MQQYIQYASTYSTYSTPNRKINFNQYTWEFLSLLEKRGYQHWEAKYILTLLLRPPTSHDNLVLWTSFSDL